MNKYKARFIIIGSVSLFCLVYLFWFFKINHNYTSPLYLPESPSFLELMMAFISLVLFTATVRAFILMFKQRLFLIPVIANIAFTLYLTGLLDFRRMISLNTCDMSICYEVNLYNDNSFVMYVSSQMSLRRYNGFFKTNGTRVILFDKGKKIEPGEEESLSVIENMKNVYCNIHFLNDRVIFLDKLNE